MVVVSLWWAAAVRAVSAPSPFGRHMLWRARTFIIHDMHDAARARQAAGRARRLDAGAPRSTPTGGMPPHEASSELECLMLVG